MKKWMCALGVVCMGFLCSCLIKDKEPLMLSPTIDKQATKETIALFDNLKKLSENHILYGHQDASYYGHSWKDEKDRSDVKEVAGSYPAVEGFDFGGISLSEGEEWEQNAARLKELIEGVYNRNGVVTICWHWGNPVNGKSFYADSIPYNTIEQLLPGASHHEAYKAVLNKIGKFAHQIKGSKGEAVPLIFRPFHEFDGDWFWWGKAHCTREQFIDLWRFTVTYLRDTLDVHNFLYAFSPDCKFNTPEEFLDRYPGDDYVDMLGVDDYWDFRPDGANDPSLAQKKLKIVSDLAQQKNKLAALTETGLEGIKDPEWHTSVLLKTLKEEKLQLSYVLVWRNAHDSPTHYYAPFPGHPAVPDFMKFVSDPYVMLCNDLPSMYTLNK